MSIWLIGTGLMAVDYAKVLKGLNKEFTVIGRGEKNAKTFEDATSVKPSTGGLENFLKEGHVLPEFVINSVGIDQLKETTLTLIKSGCKNILIEKPGVAYASEIYELEKAAIENKSNIVLAYNRRFYQSTLAAQKIIKDDGGVVSFNFEFTEWSHSIATILHLKTEAEMQNWFLGNSTHVIDMAFYLGGKPKQLAAFYAGKENLDWHKTSSNYCGAGVTQNGALFAYHANWMAPGRFSVEILTNKHRLIFRPLEKLQIQNIGSVAINMAEGIDYKIDEDYKPGLYLQTKAFLENNHTEFCTLGEQAKKMGMYKEMSGY